MTERRTDQRADDVLRILDANEIDQFAIAHLERIEGHRDVLLAVASGDMEASLYQRRNAIFVLGVLRVQEAASRLARLLESDRPALGLHALAALRKIRPDKTTADTLLRIARDENSSAPEVAYALRALSESPDKSVIEAAREEPPAHIEDSGVLVAWHRLAPTRR
jgi:hypothetical protein